MRIFGSDRIQGLMERLGMEEGVPIEHGMVTKAIERAQKQVEAQNFLRPQAPARVRRRDEQAARERLRAAPRAARRTVVLDEDEEVDSRAYLMRLAEGAGRQHDPRRTAARRSNPRSGIPRPVKRDVGTLFGLGPEQLDEVELADRNPEEMREALWTLAEAEYVEKEAVNRRRRAPPGRAGRHAAGGRLAVEGSSVRAGPPEGGYRAPGLRPAEPRWSSTSARASRCSRR